MKKLGKIKLNRLEKIDLEKREMNMVKGGSCACVGTCHDCSCAYAGEQCSSGDSYYGGSSSNDNAGANADLGGSDVNSNTA